MRNKLKNYSQTNIGHIKNVKYMNASLNKLKYNDVIVGAKCTARTARSRTPTLLLLLDYIRSSFRLCLDCIICIV